MFDRFLRLGMEVKADVVGSHIQLLESEIDLPELEAGYHYSRLFDQGCFSDEVTSTALPSQRKEG
jgi:hypothetical protein